VGKATPERDMRSFFHSVLAFRQDRFIRNIGWIGASELGIRVFRLLTTAILARVLTAQDYGLAAIALTTHEFIRVFSCNGIADKIVQAEEEEVAQLCRTAYGLNWLIAGGLFVIQSLASFFIAWFYGDRNLILPICIIALTYLIYPLTMVQTALIRRENRLNILALILMVQVSTDNLLTAVLALAGMGMWAIVLPKFLVAPIWVVMSFKYHPWRMTESFTLEKWREIFGFSTKVLGIELLSTFRENVDYLLVGRFVGVKELGIYYFAFNAGLGISLSAIRAIRVSLFSDLCNIKSNRLLFKQKYFKSLKTIAKIIVPLVLLQSALAPVYVPIIFGYKWVEQGAIPVLIFICLSALSRPFADANSLMFRAVGKPQIELYWNILFTAILTLTIWLGTGWGILGAAIAVMLTHACLQPIYTIWATRFVLARLA
jgi:PST family polysaccharide transporter